jgi:hypothetical protein
MWVAQDTRGRIAIKVEGCRHWKDAALEGCSYWKDSVIGRVPSLNGCRNWKDAFIGRMPSLEGCRHWKDAVIGRMPSRHERTILTFARSDGNQDNHATLLWSGGLDLNQTVLQCGAGIATGCGLDSPGFESRWRERFFAQVLTGPGAHPASCTMGTGSFPGVKRTGRGAEHPPLPVPGSRKSRAIPLPILSLRVC